MSDQSQYLIQQVSDAIANQQSLEITGAGSKRFYGRTCRADEILSTSNHTGIVSYQPVELVLTARAGTAIREIQQTLDEHQQMLAFEPPLFNGIGNGAGATLGGTLACNQSGPARPWAGSVRDAVLGVKLINGKAEHLNFGGQVMKNVAGFDVSRAQAGALGTLGVITDVSLKVMPKPETSTTLRVEMPADKAIEAMNKLAGLAQPVSAACWLNGQMYLRWSGVQAAVDSAIKKVVPRWGGELLENGDRFWRELNEQQYSFFNGNESLWRFSVKSSAKHWRPENQWLLDWGGSQRWLRGSFDFKALEEEAAVARGQVSLFKGGDRSDEVFATPSAITKRLQQNLKTAFDPHRIFNPGRLYSWL